MDIKDLNKPQLILLAVLLSFVTSIATGIVTVTLMQQAPVSFTAPVNRIVQQTVEKIQQVEGKTTVQTVIIKEEDLVVDAIAKNKEATFVVTKESQDLELKTIEVSAGRGFAVSTEGIVVVDGFLAPSAGVYFVKNSSGKFKAEFLYAHESGFSFLKIGASLDGKSKIVFSVPALGDITKMKVGQKVLVIGNTTSSFMFEGLVASDSMDINIAKTNTGSLVLNLDGEVLGMTLTRESGISFVSIKAINEALKALATTPKV